MESHRFACMSFDSDEIRTENNPLVASITPDPSKNIPCDRGSELRLETLSFGISSKVTLQHLSFWGLKYSPTVD